MNKLRSWKKSSIPPHVQLPAPLRGEAGKINRIRNLPVTPDRRATFYFLPVKP
ncbi:hypothetical protein KCP78_13110 [Salmonella enterica subsp. enterica]|nr:hypothetical protein KCP78_13110 [Salmonella enterica subsp. enterica]